MTQKVSRFLRDVAPATPCLVVDVDRVGENYGRLKAALPLARIYYAVKANPAAPILDRLVSLDSAFDAASWEEVQACLRAGARPDAISFGNTVKKESAIKAAFEAGVRMFAFDSEPELRKLARSAPGAKVYCRILVGNVGAEWPLSKKFGCEVEMAKELMVLAGELGLDPFGISFHVGSQQTRTAAYEAAIAKVGMLFTDLKNAGVNPRMINIGGGYPVRYRSEVPEIGEIGDAIMGAMVEAFGNNLPEMVIEPGRFVVGDAGVLSSEVVLVSRKEKDDPVRWVYLDIGRFGGLAETEGEAIKYAFRTQHDGGADGPVTIAGPTCDSTDTLYEKSNYRLPLALDAGDRIELLATGAYVTTYASQAFNGFAPLAEHYI
ncbi:type III PLP-dependent enzyme [Roseomonas aerophila]|uniref:Type III PLP-dependent enzyme n=1 Tax=Teichococcus aerophilus TaxID=1224513 RepID=A0ABR7RPE5_9PROT|nr:type III PLP-dependent enzyme [Pseudoroseomonas aerophila]MBC9208474.1 type III PLP-dependent enzyme [Pseudoroseomonas aerophila]